jgi:hypothetical protein
MSVNRDIYIACRTESNLPVLPFFKNQHAHGYVAVGLWTEALHTVFFFGAMG